MPGVLARIRSGRTQWSAIGVPLEFQGGRPPTGRFPYLATILQCDIDSEGLAAGSPTRPGIITEGQPYHGEHAHPG
jgi:hypothetical protein